MSRRPVTWRDKRDRPRASKTEVLDKPFGGVPAGAALYVSTPGEIEEVVRSLPPGTSTDLTGVRHRLAERHGTDATCPVSTSIFLRTVAEAALEELAAGAAVEDVAPFWRAVDPDGPLARRLTCGPDAVRALRDQEQPEAPGGRSHGAIT